MENYYTIKNFAENEILIQKSRFIAYAKRVYNEKEAQNFLSEIKKKHYNATHNCFAWLAGKHNEFQKANDDGEPSGTAGIPILEVIKKRELKNVVLVVTRYFGGIKLGAGGLIRAYSQAASQVIDQAGIVEIKEVRQYKAEIDYNLLGIIENEIRKTGFLLMDTFYEDKVILKIMINPEDEEVFKAWLLNLTNGNVTIEKEGLFTIEKEGSRGEGDQ